MHGSREGERTGPRARSIVPARGPDETDGARAAGDRMGARRIGHDHQRAGAGVCCAPSREELRREGEDEDVHEQTRDDDRATARQLGEARGREQGQLVLLRRSGNSSAADATSGAAPARVVVSVHSPPLSRRLPRLMRPEDRLIAHSLHEGADLRAALCSNARPRRRARAILRACSSSSKARGREGKRGHEAAVSRLRGAAQPELAPCRTPPAGERARR